MWSGILVACCASLSCWFYVQWRHRFMCGSLLFHYVLLFCLTVKAVRVVFSVDWLVQVHTSHQHPLPLFGSSSLANFYKLFSSTFQLSKFKVHECLKKHSSLFFSFKMKERQRGVMGGIHLYLFKKKRFILLKHNLAQPWTSMNDWNSNHNSQKI